MTGADFNGGVSPDRDRFILSPTHYSLVLYAALVETGRMAPDGLLEFNQDGSSVEMIGAEHSPGMEVMTGSLGQGLGQAAGMALLETSDWAPSKIAKRSIEIASEICIYTDSIVTVEAIGE